MSGLTPAPIKPIVGVAVLDALDIRVGTIERVEEIPRSDKLMKLIANFRRPFANDPRRDQERARKSA